MRLKVEITEDDLQQYLEKIDCVPAHAAREALNRWVPASEEPVEPLVATLMDESMRIGMRIGAMIQREYTEMIPGSQVDFVFPDYT